jgi:hypothetical protein
MKKRTIAAVIAGVLAVGSVTGCRPYKFRYSSNSSRSPSCNRSSSYYRRSSSSRHRVGLPHHVTPYTIQRKFQRDAAYLRAQRRR